MAELFEERIVLWESPGGFRGYGPFLGTDSQQEWANKHAGFVDYNVYPMRSLPLIQHFAPERMSVMNQSSPGTIDDISQFSDDEALCFTVAAAVTNTVSFCFGLFNRRAEAHEWFAENRDFLNNIQCLVVPVLDPG